MKKNDNKVFLITIDTEGDNQWDLNKGISTENIKYLPRFQELANKYGFKPTWLCNYEIVNDDEFVKYMKNKLKADLCEIGMHLHAWNNPPEYKLKRINKERDYLIEYPIKIMEEKIKTLTSLIEKKFGVLPVSHRSGRWSTNDDYFNLLIKYGYKIDCSVTPHVSWKNSLGSTGIEGTDYLSYSEKPYFINNSELLELPMTIKKVHCFDNKRIKNIKNLLGEMERLLLGRYKWMRPDKFLSFNGFDNIIKVCSKKQEYIMFMIHSSELMPNGSPNFKTNDDIEKLYEIIEDIFRLAKDNGYRGLTLKEYYNYYKDNSNQKGRTV